MDLQRMKEVAEEIKKNPTLFTDALAAINILIEKDALIEKYDAKKRELDGNQGEIDRLHREVKEINKVIEVKTGQVEKLNRQLESEILTKYEGVEKEEAAKIEEKTKDAQQNLKDVNVSVTAKKEELGGLLNKIEDANKTIKDMKEKL